MAALRFAHQLQTETAQTMAEYAVVLGVITLIVVASMSLLGANAANAITRVASYINF